MTILDFSERKQNHQKISMITCYDASFAKLVNNSKIDCILIGDSCSMVMHGEKTTIPATIEMMVSHTKAVRNGTDKFILSDMPFLSTRKGIEHAVDCAGKLLVAGANAVKIEGIFGQEEIIKHLVQSGIPVMSHIGLTPQFYNALGGHKRQGKTEQARQKIKEEALLSETLLAALEFFLNVSQKTLLQKLREKQKLQQSESVQEKTVTVRFLFCRICLE